MSAHRFQPRPPVSEGTEAMLERWALWMRAGGLSERTIGDRLQVLRLVESRTGVPAADAAWTDLAVVLADLAKRKPSTRATYYQHMRSWYRWLSAVVDYRVDDPTAKLHRVKRPRSLPRPVTVDQLRHLLGTGRFYGRTRTMILLAAYQGLRVHEIAKLRGEDFTPGGLRVVGKGGVEAILPVHPVVDAERAQYPARGWWFPSYKLADQPVQPSAVSQAIGKALRRSGIDATAHQLRHYFGTEVHRASGGDLRVAQELLRHASPATTAIYTKVDDSERLAAMLAMPSLN